MRLFIGVELDERVKSAAADAADTLRTTLKRARVDLDARWVEPENLHVTVWFIGEAGEARAAEIRRTLEPRFATPAFDLHVNGLGAFPPSGPPRVFWLGIAEGAESMGHVYNELRVRLVALGLQPERRPYSPHITVARVRGVRSRFSSSSKNRDLTPKAGGGGQRGVREALEGVSGDCGVCRVSAVTLFHSHLSPHGARYEPLLRIPLS
jgi:2'-5' RNA ligase